MNQYFTYITSMFYRHSSDISSTFKQYFSNNSATFEQNSKDIELAFQQSSTDISSYILMTFHWRFFDISPIFPQHFNNDVMTFDWHFNINLTILERLHSHNFPVLLPICSIAEQPSTVRRSPNRLHEFYSILS